MSVALTSAFKVKDDLYSFSGHYGLEHQRFMVTFDFGPAQYQLFLAALLPDLREKVRSALSEQPYRFFFLPPDAVSMTIVGDLGDKTFTNENESYRP